MTWNYRIIFHDEDPDAERHWYGLHEVYYAKDGTPRSWTIKEVGFVAAPEDGPAGIVAGLQKALHCAHTHPVLRASELPRDAA